MAMDFLTSPMQWSSCKFLRLALAFLLLASFGRKLAAQSAQTEATTPAIGNAAVTPAHVPLGETPTSALRLEAGDLVEVGVYKVPELTTKARVSSKGEIYLPLIDYVHVADLTAEEAEGVIQKRLADGGFVKNTHVTLFPEKAGRSIQVTHRDLPDQPITVPLSRNVTDNPESNVPILPGDTIIVRKADLVYVVGDVGRPSGFLMDSGHLTVLQAIAMAGGTTRTANLGGARIIRRGTGGPSETPVELKKILRAKAPDLTMQADDILFVPTSTAKIIAGRTFEAAVQAATAVSIVALP